MTALIELTKLEYGTKSRPTERKVYLNTDHIVLCLRRSKDEAVMWEDDTAIWLSDGDGTAIYVTETPEHIAVLVSARGAG